MKKLTILNRFGDSVIEYTETDTEAAEREFYRLVRPHGSNLAYRVDAPGKGTQITEFDPSADEIIITGPLVGG